MHDVYLYRSVNVSLPDHTLTNGSLFLHIFLHPHGESAFSGTKSIHRVVPVTAYKVPVSYFKLMGETKNQSVCILFILL